MMLLVQVIGGLIALAGVILLFKRHLLIDLLRERAAEPALFWSAIAGRALLGALLLGSAARSRYPFVIELLGGLSLLAAIGLLLLGRERFTRLVNWAISIAGPLHWLGGLFVVMFGGFLIHAFH